MLITEQSHAYRRLSMIIIIIIMIIISKLHTRFCTSDSEIEESWSWHVTILQIGKVAVDGHRAEVLRQRQRLCRNHSVPSSRIHIKKINFSFPPLLKTQIHTYRTRGYIIYTYSTYIRKISNKKSRASTRPNPYSTCQTSHNRHTAP